MWLIEQSVAGKVEEHLLDLDFWLFIKTAVMSSFTSFNEILDTSMTELNKTEENVRNISKLLNFGKLL